MLWTVAQLVRFYGSHPAEERLALHRQLLEKFASASRTLLASAVHGSLSIPHPGNPDRGGTPGAAGFQMFNTTPRHGLMNACGAEDVLAMLHTFWWWDGILGLCVRIRARGSW